MYVIVIGVNNLTQKLVEWYSEYEHEVTVIEKDIEKCHYFDQLFGPICQNGDACDPEIQSLAGMDRADILIVATKSDKDNFLIGMIAKSKYNVKKTINLANDSNYIKAFSYFGIDTVINIESMILRSIEQETSILAPWSITELNTNPKKIILGVRIDSYSKIIGKSIKDIILPNHSSIILLIRANGITDTPTEHKTIHSDDELLILTEEKNKNIMLEYLS